MHSLLVDLCEAVGTSLSVTALVLAIAVVLS
jgi:hypothetical protein